MKLPIGEKIFEANFSTGENAVATAERTPLARLIPRRSSVIRNNAETSKRTSSRRERLPPPLATNELPYKLFIVVVQRLKPFPRLQTLQYIYQILQQQLVMAALRYELASQFHGAISHQGRVVMHRHQLKQCPDP